MTIRTRLLLALLLPGAIGALSCGRSLLCQMPEAGEATPFVLKSRATHLRLDPATHGLRMVDSLRVSGPPTRFDLCAGLELESLEIDGRTVPAKYLVKREHEGDGPCAPDTWLLTRCAGEARLVVIRASGEFWQDPANMSFGHEKVGNELLATVGEEGIWIAPEAAVLAHLGEPAFVPHRVHLDLPEGWSGVTQGRLVADRPNGGRHTMTWEETLPTEGVSIVANRYDVRREDHGGVEISSWFARRDEPFLGHDGKAVDDEAVRATLHRMSAYYLDMYDELLGAYPYAKFAVVESFFPAGYGMPSWTLLGDAVIRMPYIPYTSLGHELLHNYWGNGVFVDADEGNWCEGLTVYDADYRYKRLESDAAGRDYRKNVLKDNRSWVHAGGVDLPLKDFRSRHDGATRSVGYGKSMMVFVMLENLLGREAFDDVQREIWNGFQGRAAAWSDWMAACERKAQLDLSRFSEQWLARTGAPALELADVDWTDGVLSGTVRQTQPGAPYELDIPLVVESHDGAVLRETVFADGRETAFSVPCAEPRKATLDPDYEIFRLLDAREMEPVVSLALADPAPVFAAPAAWLADPARREALAAFSAGLSESGTPWIAWEELDPGTLGRAGLVGVDPPALPAGAEFVDLRLSEDGWSLAGHEGRFADGSLVLAVKSALAEDKAALLFFVPGPEQLPALARKVPHYGKYSYLAFDGAGTNTLKGNLAPRGNPLEVRFGSW